MRNYYTPDSLYNVHYVHLTLPEYQMAMNMSLKRTDIQMGDFQNMVICDDWAAVRYDITSTSRETGESSDGTVMEFVNFKDYGDELGVRVVEGWAGTKGAVFDAMTSLQTEEEQAKQAESTEVLLNTVIPETDDLAVKYPVAYPTSIDEETGIIIQNAILSDFENWNQGYNVWEKWADEYYSNDYISTSDNGTQTLAEYKESVKNEIEGQNITRISFNNMLISGDWAAVYYNITKTDEHTGEKTIGTVMQFLHFELDGENTRVVESWTE